MKVAKHKLESVSMSNLSFNWSLFPLWPDNTVPKKNTSKISAQSLCHIGIDGEIVTKQIIIILRLLSRLVFTFYLQINLFLEITID